MSVSSQSTDDEFIINLTNSSEFPLLFDVSDDEMSDLVETAMILIDNSTTEQDWVAATFPEYYTEVANDLFEIMSIRDSLVVPYDNLRSFTNEFIVCDKTLMMAIKTGMVLYHNLELYRKTPKLYLPPPPPIVISPNNDLLTHVEIRTRIDELRLIPQPAQRTAEWYAFRSLLLTASNFYKVFGSQAAQNQLIYEKCTQFNTPFCEPTEGDIPRSVNVSTPMHWGQKYEPMSTFLYEHRTDAVIEEFGCIRHENYSCIGASPDGINVNPKSKIYGRMLEIKNVKSRVITGVPKNEYWVQMQIQMEVCGLDECDFLETKFIEYESVREFIDDSDDNDMFKSKHEGKQKGMVIYFTKPNGVPFYVFNPLSHTTINELREWALEEVKKYTSPLYNYTYIMKNYWKLEVYSCVLVKRNKKWFNDGLDKVLALWATVEKERMGDYSHRAPKKRVLSAAAIAKAESKKKEATCPEVDTTHSADFLFKMFNASNQENK
jgi:putative phage-type endonuclease